MRIAGIIAEYNPFHNGHAWQIQQLRELGFEAVVCVCSPAVVQRGTFALFPTQVRVRAALLGGADAVLSLPAPFACASAEGFAAAGVRLLSALGVCEAIAFGAETADVQALHAAVNALESEAFQPLVRSLLAQGLPFPAARAAAAEQLAPGSGSLLRTPNNILGVEYCRALHRLRAEGHANVPHALPLPRTGAAHDAPLPQQGMASASALRALLAQQGVEALAPYVPKACLAVYRQAVSEGNITDARACSIAVLSRLRTGTAQDFAKLRGVNEGLENRLAAAVRAAPTLEALYEALKTKRYPTARLRRLVLDAALEYTPSLPSAPPYLHVLGATARGRAALALASRRAWLPCSHSLALLRSAGGAARSVADAHAAAEDLAALCLASPAPQAGAYMAKYIAL